MTQSGEIDDGGGTPGVVEVSGGGSFNPTNAANGYSGGTIVTDDSTLSIADDHALGASTGDLTLGDATTAGTLVVTATLSSTRDVTLEAGGGTIAPDAGVIGELGGDITGEGELTKTDDGMLVLTGTNDYSGGTNVFGGVLQGTTTSLQGDITDNAILVFDQGSTGTYAGDISGTGSLTKLGTGTVILAGTNDYSGGTNVSQRHAAGHAPTSLQGDITDNAILVFDQGSTGTYAGAISGTGSLTKIGTGTLILAGVNDYFGGTTVSAGTLQGTHHEPAGRHHRQCQPGLRPEQHRDLCRRYRRHGLADQARNRHGDPRRQQQLYRRHDGRRRHAAGHDRRACRATSPTMPAWSSTRRHRHLCRRHLAARAR